MFRHYSSAEQQSQEIVDALTDFESPDLKHACCVQNMIEKAVVEPSQASTQEDNDSGSKEVLTQRSKLNTELGFSPRPSIGSAETDIASIMTAGNLSGHHGSLRGHRRRKVLCKLRSHRLLK